MLIELARPEESAVKKRKRNSGNATCREYLRDQRTPQRSANSGPIDPSCSVPVDFQAPEPPEGLDKRALKRWRRERQASLEKLTISKRSPAPAEATRVPRAGSKLSGKAIDHFVGENRREKRRKRKRARLSGVSTAEADPGDEPRITPAVSDAQTASHAPLSKYSDVRTGIHITHHTGGNIPHPPPRLPHSKLSTPAARHSNIELLHQISTTKFPRAPIKHWSDGGEPDNQLRRVSSVHERAEKSCQTEIFGQLHLPLVFVGFVDAHAGLPGSVPSSTALHSPVKSQETGLDATTAKPRQKMISKTLENPVQQQTRLSRQGATSLPSTVDEKTSIKRSPASENESTQQPPEFGAIASGKQPLSAEMEESTDGDSTDGDSSDDQVPKSSDNALDVDSHAGVAAFVEPSDRGDAASLGDHGAAPLRSEESVQDQDMAVAGGIAPTEDAAEDAAEQLESEAVMALAGTEDESMDEGKEAATADDAVKHVDDELMSEARLTTKGDLEEDDSHVVISDDEDDGEGDSASGGSQESEVSKPVEDANIEDGGDNVRDDQSVTRENNAELSKALLMKPTDHLRSGRATPGPTIEEAGSKRSQPGQTNTFSAKPRKLASAVHPSEPSEPEASVPRSKTIETIIITSDEEESSELESSSEEEAPAVRPMTSGTEARTLATSADRTNRSAAPAKPIVRSSPDEEENDANRASRQSSLFAGIDSRKTYLGVGAGNRCTQQPARQPAKKAVSVPSTVPQTDAKTAFNRFRAFLGEDSDDEESSSSSSDELDTNAAPASKPGAGTVVAVGNVSPWGQPETSTRSESAMVILKSAQPVATANKALEVSESEADDSVATSDESEDGENVDNCRNATLAPPSENLEVSKHEDDSENEEVDEADQPPAPRSGPSEVRTTRQHSVGSIPVTPSANNATEQVQQTPSFTQINNERASQQLTRESQAAERLPSKFATFRRSCSTRSSGASRGNICAHTGTVLRSRLPNLDDDVGPDDEHSLEPTSETAAPVKLKSAAVVDREETKTNTVGIVTSAVTRTLKSATKRSISAKKATPETEPANTSESTATQSMSASRVSAAAQLREARLRSARKAAAARIEVPDSQKTNDTAISDGHSEDDEAWSDLPARASKSISSTHPTSASTRSDSRTSFSVSSEQDKPSASQPASFLVRRLGGAGSGGALNVGNADTDLLATGKPSDALGNTQSLYRDIDEVTNEVMSSTRELPVDKPMRASQSPDIESPTIERADNAGKVKQVSRRRSLGKGKMIPIVARQEITCFAVQLPSHVIEPCVEANGWMPPNRTDEPDEAEQPAESANIGLTDLEKQTSGSSLSERAKTSTPPPEIIEPPVRQTSWTTDDAEDVSASSAAGNCKPEPPKKKRKMTGNSSKHFNERTKRENAGRRALHDRVDELEPEALKNGPSTPLAERTKQNPARPRRRTTGTKSPHFLPFDKLDRVDLPSSSQKKGGWPAGVSRAPVPPTTAERFGIIQEKLWQEPFWLLIAATFLNQTTGRAAAPVFWDLKNRWPNPEDLAVADRTELLDMINHLGLQRLRTDRVIAMANAWIADPPQVGRRFRTRHYPAKDDQRQFIKLKVVETDAEDCAGALEIGHIPGCGPYAWDSWRIFCRDVLRGVAEDYNGKGSTVEDFQPEWKRVVPKDKELRATLRWMWLREGYIWDHNTGERREATEEEKEKARLGQMEFADEKEERFAEIAAGTAQAGEGAEPTKYASSLGAGGGQEDRAERVMER